MVTEPGFGEQKETVLDEQGDPAVVYLIDKNLNRAYVSTVRVFMNGPSIYRPTININTFL